MFLQTSHARENGFVCRQQRLQYYAAHCNAYVGVRMGTGDGDHDRKLFPPLWLCCWEESSDGGVDRAEELVPIVMCGMLQDISVAEVDTCSSVCLP